MDSFKTTVNELRKQVIAREGPSHYRTEDSKVLVCTLHFYYTLHMVSQMTKVVETCVYLIHTYGCKTAQFLILHTAVCFFITKPTRCTIFPNLLRYENLHVSDSSSAHHQELIHSTLSNVIYRRVL